MVTVSCVQFALFFVDFWFQLALDRYSMILGRSLRLGFGADRPHASLSPH